MQVGISLAVSYVTTVQPGSDPMCVPDSRVSGRVTSRSHIIGVSQLLRQPRKCLLRISHAYIRTGCCRPWLSCNWADQWDSAVVIKL